MERFNLDTWLEDKSRKVVTRNNKPVRIVCWDKLGDYPIIGCVKYSDEYEDLESYNSDGFKYSLEREDQNDLFFADDEPSKPYNPYKFAVESILKMAEKYEPYCRVDIDSTLPDFLNNVKVKCNDAIEYDKMFPQEEFVSKKQYDEDLDKAYKNADKVQFNRGMSEILNNPQKYFHVGDTIRMKGASEGYTITSIFNGRYYGEGWSLDIIKAADIFELVEDCNEMNMTPQEREVYNAHKKRMKRFTEKIGTVFDEDKM